MRPLRRIFSISAADLQTIAILSCAGAVALDLLENLLRHLVHRQTAVHCNQPPFARVVLRHRPGLLLIRGQTFPDHFLAVIIADDQLGTVKVANFIDAGWLKMDVINVSVGGASPASGEPEQK